MFDVLGCKTRPFVSTLASPRDVSLSELMILHPVVSNNRQCVVADCVLQCVAVCCSRLQCVERGAVDESSPS